jgi:hypothetical protein
MGASASMSVRVFVCLHACGGPRTIGRDEASAESAAADLVEEPPMGRQPIGEKHVKNKHLQTPMICNKCRVDK